MSQNKEELVEKQVEIALGVIKSLQSYRNHKRARWNGKLGWRRCRDYYVSYYVSHYGTRPLPEDLNLLSGDDLLLRLANRSVVRVKTVMGWTVVWVPGHPGDDYFEALPSDDEVNRAKEKLDRAVRSVGLMGDVLKAGTRVKIEIEVDEVMWWIEALRERRRG